MGSDNVVSRIRRAYSKLVNARMSYEIMASLLISTQAMMLLAVVESHVSLLVVMVHLLEGLVWRTQYKDKVCLTL